MSTPERIEVRESFRERFLSDRETDSLRHLAEYQNDYPGYWDVVADEYQRLGGTSSIDPLRAAANPPSSEAPVAAPAADFDLEGPTLELNEADIAAAAAQVRDSYDVPEELRHLGPYRLLRELGVGGQGTVFLAEDTRIGNRRVALKVLPPGTVVSENLMHRFRREAEIASRLDHPGICTVFGADIERDVPYIAMRYIEGRPLSDWIEKRRKQRILDSQDGSPTSGVHLPGLPEERSGRQGSLESVHGITRFIKASAHALHAAHAANLVHRDIKPGNLMVTLTGDPVLLDFGLAQDSEQGHTLTVAGAPVGTPSYMAPEQIVTEAGRVDLRADVYSLGVTLYEALTLQRPFEAHSRDALYQMILRDEPESPRTHNPHIPRDLEVVVLTALEKSPDRRYQTARDLAEDLGHVLKGEPVKARPIGPLRRMGRTAMRNPARTIAAAAVFLLLFGAFGISQYYLRELVKVRRESDDAQAELIQMRTRPRANSTETATVNDRTQRALEHALVVLEDPRSASAADVDRARRAVAEELWVHAFDLERSGEPERAADLLGRVLKASQRDARLRSILVEVVSSIANVAGDSASGSDSRRDREGEARLLASLEGHDDPWVREQATLLHDLIAPPVTDDEGGAGPGDEADKGSR